MTDEEFDNTTFKSLNILVMPKKKPQEPIVVNPLEPLQCCYDCIHWHPNTEKRTDFAVDFSTGCCDHNGYSKVPPLFTCNGWASGDGSIIDKLEHF